MVQIDRPFLISSFYNPYQNLIILYTSDRHSQVYLSGLYIFSLNKMKRRIISPLKQAVAARKRFRLFISSKNCMHKSRRAYSENKFRKHITCQEFAVLLFTLALDYLNLKYDQIFNQVFFIISTIGYLNALNIPLRFSISNIEIWWSKT